MRRNFSWSVVIGALVASGVGLYALAQLSRVENFQWRGEMIARVETDQPLVAITFDDGPTARHTPEILAALAENDALATFFVMGKSAAKHSDEMQAIHQAGHEIGNHSYTHKPMIFRPHWRLAAELRDTDAAISATGYVTPYDAPLHFRPPYGRKLFGLPWVLEREGRLSVMWSDNPEENMAPDFTPEALAAQTVAQAEAGDIILLHPWYASRQRTRDALPSIIKGLRAKGLEPVTLSALLAAGN